MRIVAEGCGDGSVDIAELLVDCRDLLHELDRKLTRFDAASELSALNAAAEPVVRVSQTLCRAVEAALWAAERSDGLVDSTIIDALEESGYGHRMQDAVPVSLREALRLAPARRAAAPRAGSRWREISCDPAAGTITRPPGVRLDLGGTAKGLAADLVGVRLAGLGRWVVDCGGDLVIGGTVGGEPQEVVIDDPFSEQAAAVIVVEGGGVATSGVDVRLWRSSDGRYCHHLIDPSTLSSAWTGVVSATALGRSALEAETIAKTAVLVGLQGAHSVLEEFGGVVVTDDRNVLPVGPVRVLRSRRDRSQPGW